MQELKIYKSPWKAIRLLLLCSIFVVPSVLLLTWGGDKSWQLWVGAGFFGLGYPLGIFQLFDRRPLIIVNEVGIFDRSAHYDFINWELIEDAYLVKMRQQCFICLVINEAFEPSRKQGKFKRGVAELNKSLGFQELNISLGSVSTNPERLAIFILAMRTAEKPERTELVAKAIANL